MSYLTPPAPPFTRPFEHSTVCELEANLRSAKEAQQTARTFGFPEADRTVGRMVEALQEECRYRRAVDEYEALRAEFTPCDAAVGPVKVGDQVWTRTRLPLCTVVEISDDGLEALCETPDGDSRWEVLGSLSVARSEIVVPS